MEGNFGKSWLDAARRILGTAESTDHSGESFTDAARRILKPAGATGFEVSDTYIVPATPLTSEDWWRASQCYRTARRGQHERDARAKGPHL
ncbi:hypothetical protein A2Y99_03105 [Candidatus Gottesmanbacteria bacterium RBG_13_37_7]|uniref:Uncharacterized protein n=1 Tax=Candidatus Gottesmanbacteria bacterium RBG_13_37_7 TaxID=1798369 RepID=A0A1F5YGU7_9BACT|nr:MAG: hypothetical protein A2Y99_03105 [Candidatus Gottesmanbacteria bacterium RBG_13_37_7]